MKSLLCCLSVLTGFELFAAYAYVTNVIDDVVWKYRIDGTSAQLLRAELTEPSSSDVRKCIVIPKTVSGTTVNTVADDAFYSSDWLRSVTIPSSVTQIGMKSFAHCSNLVSVIIEQDGKSYGLHRIGAFAFWRCVSLGNINLKDADHLSMIGRGAFEGCESLDHIKLPDHGEMGATLRDMELAVIAHVCRREDQHINDKLKSLRGGPLKQVVEEFLSSMRKHFKTTKEECEKVYTEKLRKSVSDQLSVDAMKSHYKWDVGEDREHEVHWD